MPPGKEGYLISSVTKETEDMPTPWRSCLCLDLPPALQPCERLIWVRIPSPFMGIFDLPLEVDKKGKRWTLHKSPL